MSVDPLSHYPPEYVADLRRARDEWMDAALRLRQALDEVTHVSFENDEAMWQFAREALDGTGDFA